MPIEIARIASGAQDSLEKMVAQRMLEQMQEAKLRDMQMNQQAEQQRIGLQGRQLDVQSENNALNRQIRQDTLKQQATNQKNLDEDRDEQRFQGRLKLYTKGQRLSPGETGDFANRGMSSFLRPIQNEPAFEFAGTQDTENKENALQAQQQHREVMEALQAGRLSVAEAMAKVAELRASWGPAPIQFQSVDAAGNPVLRVLPRGEAVGQNFPTRASDDPSLPRGVAAGLSQYLAQGLSYDQAVQALAKELPNQQRVHPQLDPQKAFGALRSVYQQPTGRAGNGVDALVNSVLAGTGGRGPSSGQSGGSVTGGAQAPGTQERTVTMQDLQAIAQRRGTSVEQERQRATASGYVIR